jgi:GntR family transcriptional regulator/MocR family aminotransferase
VDATGLVIHVGTFSKSLFPSLRLGYLLAPPALVQPLDAIMSRLMHGVPTHTQAVVADFIGEGHFAAHIRRMRRLYAERHEALCSAAAAQLGEALEVERSSSGLHTVGWLRAGHDEAAVVSAAAQRQVTVSPIARYAIAPRAAGDRQGLVLGFGGVTAAEIERGVGVLAQVLGRRRPS